jgi:hypothetical protein
VNLGSTNYDVVARPQRRGWIRVLVAMCVLGMLAPTVAEAGRRKKGGRKSRSASPAPAPTPAPTPASPETANPGDEADVPVAADGPVDAKESGGKGGKPKVFDFTGLDINGRLRTPQLLYFLERANEELERASLERRSFIPEMVRTLDEGML